MKIKWHPIAVLVVCMVFSSLSAFGQTVRISWSSNTEKDLDCYTVYYGPSSRNYTNILSAGLATSLDLDAKTLTQARVYYFAVTAKDIYGNESVMSQEVSLAIPEAASAGGNTGTGNGQSTSALINTGTGTDSGSIPGMLNISDSDSDGIPDAVEVSYGLDPNNPLDALQDSDGDTVVNLVEYMTGTDPLNPISLPSSDEVLKDLIGEVGEVIDLAAINPAGKYSFKPFLGSYPGIVDNTVTMANPGVYLYNVYDANGTMVFCLRISIATKLFTTGSFEPGAPLNLEELSMGITINLRADAALRKVPIGIANAESGALSAANYTNGDSIEFELIPYGLTLAEPAQISVEFDGDNPIVQKFNEQDGSWNTIAGVSAQDGLVQFSAQKLGKFRIYSESTGKTNTTSGDSGGGGGGGCFITTSSL